MGTLAAFHKVGYFRFHYLFWEHLVPRMKNLTYTHTHSAAVFPPQITWHSVPENPSRQVLTSQHGNSFTQSLSSPDAFHPKQSGNPSARLWEGVIKRRVKTDPNPPEHRECLYSQPSNTHKSSAPTHASLKPNQCNAKGCLQSVLFMSL